jgi:SAM-dependent MidA family methyltransferase
LLAHRLKERIRLEGPITFHDWMQAALYDTGESYYNRSDLKRWGREGDYRTSPERSGLFAAAFARYFTRLYDELQRPSHWAIVEGGAGDGRFAATALRTLKDKFPQVFDATRYVLLEVSSDAREQARERVSEFGERVQFASFVDLSPIDPGIYFSNELLDAFPVHRLIKTQDGLSEVYVTVDGDGKFAWSVGPLSTPRLSEFCREYSIELENGQIIEVNLAIDEWLALVVQKLKSGYLITVDYGAEACDLYDASLRRQGSLRAFSRHGFVDDVLAQPGDYDITASINWTQVKVVGERLGLETVDFAQQDQFLLRAGLLEELEERLTSAATEADKLSLSAGAREMILPGGMASSFQVLVQKRG